MFYLIYFFTKRIGVSRGATSFLSGGTVLHATYTIALGVLLGRHPMATIFEFLSFVAMTMAIIYLFLETYYKNKFIGAFVVPAVFVLQFIASIGVDVSSTLVPMLREVKFALHASMFASAYAAYFLGVLFAVMLLMFERSLKQKNYGIIFEQLPSLSILVKMTISTTVIGFIFMTVGLGIGAHTAASAVQGFHMDPKIGFTVLVWLVYAFVIFAHFFLRWSDRRTAILNLLGFVLLALSTVISHASISSWHQFVR
ncbi:MAG: cytochrome c biogenesis protein CcsA [Deltaproteobacteria bacterium]|nr:cytochrome c biogenesis protein CcsA [Deltaproteobacteria bacterium]MBN2672373.1 cytochrome c biogenesis protein CcsA [Deltaproteobacteria bacterium]